MATIARQQTPSSLLSGKEQNIETNTIIIEHYVFVVFLLNFLIFGWISTSVLLIFIVVSSPAWQVLVLLCEIIKNRGGNAASGLPFDFFWCPLAPLWYPFWCLGRPSGPPLPHLARPCPLGSLSRPWVGGFCL